MRHFKIISAFLVLIMIASCTSKTVNVKADNSAVVNPDSLMGIWNSAWNSKDSVTISKLFTKESQVVFAADERLVGSDSIMGKWISKHLPMVKNLKTNKFSSGATAYMAYYSGDYTLDIFNKDSKIGADAGCFTAIWKKQNDNSWKMELLFFGKNTDK